MRSPQKGHRKTQTATKKNEDTKKYTKKYTKKHKSTKRTQKGHKKDTESTKKFTKSPQKINIGLIKILLENSLDVLRQ